MKDRFKFTDYIKNNPLLREEEIPTAETPEKPAPAWEVREMGRFPDKRKAELAKDHYSRFYSDEVSDGAKVGYTTAENLARWEKEGKVTVTRREKSRPGNPTNEFVTYMAFPAKGSE